MKRASSNRETPAAIANVAYVCRSAQGERCSSWAASDRQPKRIVVELDASEYRALEQLGRGGAQRSLSPAQLVRLVAV
jgi:hypothetical protein